jgi:hypothetical protein
MEESGSTFVSINILLTAYIINIYLFDLLALI